MLVTLTVEDVMTAPVETVPADASVTVGEFGSDELVTVGPAATLEEAETA